MAKKRRIFKILDGGIAPDRVEKKTASQAAPPNAPTPFARQEMLPGHKKKKKGSRNASSRSPPQERQPEERLTTAAWLRAFLHRYLRHLPGWLLRVFRLAVTDTTATGAPGFSETAPTTRGADQALPAGPPEEKKAIAIRQARLYEAPLHNSARRQWNQRESTTQLLDRPRPTMEQIYKEYTKTVDPFELQGNHRQYQIMRDSIKSTTFDKDICFVCYIKQTHQRSKPVLISNRNMESHFERLHLKLGKVRCRHCEAMFPTRHLEWHTLHCHP